MRYYISSASDLLKRLLYFLCLWAFATICTIIEQIYLSTSTGLISVYQAMELGFIHKAVKFFALIMRESLKVFQSWKCTKCSSSFLEKQNIVSDNFLKKYSQKELYKLWFHPE